MVETAPTPAKKPNAVGKALLIMGLSMAILCPLSWFLMWGSLFIPGLYDWCNYFELWTDLHLVTVATPESPFFQAGAIIAAVGAVIYVGTVFSHEQLSANPLPSPRRFRFTLKNGFIAISIICIALAVLTQAMPGRLFIAVCITAVMTLSASLMIRQAINDNAGTRVLATLLIVAGTVVVGVLFFRLLTHPQNLIDTGDPTAFTGMAEEIGILVGAAVSLIGGTMLRIHQKTVIYLFMFQATKPRDKE